MTTDPRDQLLDFPYADMPTTELLALLDAERVLSVREPDPFAQRTHAILVSLLQREVAVRNRRATVAIDEARKARVRDALWSRFSPGRIDHMIADLAERAAESMAEDLDQYDRVNAESLALIESLRDQLAIAGDHRDTYRGRAETLGREHSRLAELVEVLRCGDLAAFADGELSEDRAVAFRDHLGRCVACQRGLETDIKMDARLAEIAVSRPPPTEALERNMRALGLLAPDNQPVVVEEEPTVAPLTEERLQEIEHLCAAADASLRCITESHCVTRCDLVSAVPELLTEIQRLKLAGGA